MLLSRNYCFWQRTIPNAKQTDRFSWYDISFKPIYSYDKTRVFHSPTPPFSAGQVSLYIYGKNQKLVPNCIATRSPLYIYGKNHKLTLVLLRGVIFTIYYGKISKVDLSPKQTALLIYTGKFQNSNPKRPPQLLPRRSFQHSEVKNILFLAEKCWEHNIFTEIYCENYFFVIYWFS